MSIGPSDGWRRSSSSAKELVHQLGTDAAEIFGTVAAAEEWIKYPSLTLPNINLNIVKPKLFRTREHHLTCLNPECNRKFANVAERNYHMHIVHTTHINNSTEMNLNPSPVL